MGLRHVLEHYLRGLRVGPASLGGLPDLDGNLRDMQFESAWRMCEWDPGLAVGHVGVAWLVGARGALLVFVVEVPAVVSWCGC